MFPPHLFMLSSCVQMVLVWLPKSGNSFLNTRNKEIRGKHRKESIEDFGTGILKKCVYLSYQEYKYWCWCSCWCRGLELAFLPEKSKAALKTFHMLENHSTQLISVQLAICMKPCRLDSDKCHITPYSAAYSGKALYETCITIIILLSC